MIISKGTIKIGDFELPIISMDVSYAPFTEYGTPPEHPNCKVSSDNFIDSTAIVIDEDVLALPAPMAEKEIDKYDAIFLEIIEEVKRERNGDLQK